MTRALPSHWAVVSVLLAGLCDCFLAAIVAKNETTFPVCGPNGTLCEHECINGVWLSQTAQCKCKPGYKGVYCKTATKVLDCMQHKTCLVTRQSAVHLQRIYLIAIVSSIATILVIVCGFGCFKMYSKCSPLYKGVYCKTVTKVFDCMQHKTCRSTRQSAVYLQRMYLIAIVGSVAAILVTVCGFGCFKVWHRKSDYEFSTGIGIPVIVISV